MTKNAMAEQALAFAWAIHLEFPAAERLLEEWASQKVLESNAPLIELSDVLGNSRQERREGLLRLARDAVAVESVHRLLDLLENGLKIEGRSFQCRDVFYNLERLVRASTDDTPIPYLPLSKERTEAIFKYYGSGRDDWDTEPIYGSESCGAVVELLQALEFESTAETVQGASQCLP